MASAWSHLHGLSRARPWPTCCRTEIPLKAVRLEFRFSGLHLSYVMSDSRRAAVLLFAPRAERRAVAARAGDGRSPNDPGCSGSAVGRCGRRRPRHAELGGAGDRHTRQLRPRGRVRAGRSGRQPVGGQWRHDDAGGAAARRVFHPDLRCRARHAQCPIERGGGHGGRSDAAIRPRGLCRRRRRSRRGDRAGASPPTAAARPTACCSTSRVR